MKVLLITTIDERNFYSDLGLWKKIIKINPKSNVFSVNMYVDYLTRTKKVSYPEAVLLAFSAGKAVSAAENCIIIGNSLKDIEFDEILTVEEVDYLTLDAIIRLCGEINQDFPPFYRNKEVQKIQKDEAGAQLLIDLEGIKSVKTKS